jgi:hypothetical protein
VQITWDKPLDLKVDKTLGYVYFMDRSHPLANGQGKVYYHRHVASLTLGRWVTPEEHVHHIDEDRGNNDPANLEVLTQEQHGRKHRPLPPPRDCPTCGNSFVSGQNNEFCSLPCSYQARKKFDPTKEELEKLVWAMPSTQIAKHYGVSPSAVQKRCKRLGIKKPGRGYWTKHKPLA